MFTSTKGFMRGLDSLLYLRVLNQEEFYYANLFQGEKY